MGAVRMIEYVSFPAIYIGFPLSLSQDHYNAHVLRTTGLPGAEALAAERVTGKPIQRLVAIATPIASAEARALGSTDLSPGPTARYRWNGPQHMTVFSLRSDPA